VFAPLLRVVLAVVAALPGSAEVAAQAGQFVESHHRALLRVLEDRAQAVQEEDLVELELVVQLTARLTTGTK
jgi:hypothetical protein